jgi:hypothetical protein
VSCDRRSRERWCERRAAAERPAVVHALSFFIFSKLNSAKMVVILVRIDLAVNLVGIDFCK